MSHKQQFGTGADIARPTEGPAGFTVSRQLQLRRQLAALPYQEQLEQVKPRPLASFAPFASEHSNWNPGGASASAPVVQMARALDQQAPPDQKKLQIETLFITFPSRLAATYFKGGATWPKPLNGNPTLAFDSSIPASDHKPLDQVARELERWKAFAPGKVFTVRLDLSGRGRKPVTIRYAWIPGKPPRRGRRPPARNGKVTVDVAVKPTDQNRVATVRGNLRVGALRFPLRSGVTADQKPAFQRALALIPKGALQLVDGLAFSVQPRKINLTTLEYADKVRAKKVTEGGAYDEKAHECQMKHWIWDYPDTRFGDEDGAARCIVHEIGHAVDRAPLREATGDYQKAKAELATAKKGKVYKSPMGDRSFVKVDQAKVAAARLRLRVAEAKLKRTQSESGTKGTLSGGQAGRIEARKKYRGTFRAACKLDGVVVPRAASGKLKGGPTDYSNTNWEEMYAEAFSLYCLDPNTLKLVRPKIYEYFKGKYPQTAAAAARARPNP